MKDLKIKKNVEALWPVNNKKVLVRVDFNVPIKNGIISNDYRIRSTLPTIKNVINQGGMVILMSHLGRPKGIKYSENQADNEYKRMVLQTWMSEHGTGKTTYFAVLSGEEKKKVLSWSSKAEEAAGLSEEYGQGKTNLFSSLPEDEKKAILDLLTVHKRQETLFPQLRQYKGFDEELSLGPVAKRLEDLLRAEDDVSDDVKVSFAEDCLNAQKYVDALQPGQVLLLENVRFYSNESSKKESDRLAMAKKIASYGDYFVSDAFGTAHRDSATMTGVPKVLGHGAGGYLMDKEIKYFASVLHNPPRPMVAIVGGAKVSDKILLLENMLTHIDKLIIGGAMAYTFLSAQGISIGKSYHEAGQSFTDRYGEPRNIDDLALELLDMAKSKGIEVLLPVDHVCHTACAKTDEPLVTDDANVPDGYMALDIGPKTIALFKECIIPCRAAIWNGPMGVFELSTYCKGTYSIAETLGDCTQQNNMLTIIGGGDSASAAEKCKQASRLTHVSTGGGASLELLEGKILPGISALSDA